MPDGGPHLFEQEEKACLFRQLKFTVPGIVLSALLVAWPAAFAQNMNYQGTTSKPGASFQKDNSKPSVTETSKKHMVSHKKKHHAKAMNYAVPDFRTFGRRGVVSLFRNICGR